MKRSVGPGPGCGYRQTLPRTFPDLRPGLLRNLDDICIVTYQKGPGSSRLPSCLVSSTGTNAWCAPMLNQQHVSLLVRRWTVLDTPGNDEQLSWAKGHIPCSHLNRHPSLEHEETIVGLRVVVPDELPLELGHHQVMVVEDRDGSRLPILRDGCECLIEIDTGHHVPLKTTGVRTAGVGQAASETPGPSNMPTSGRRRR